MKIILFGTGCDLCREIAGNVDMAIESSPLTIDFEKCSDLHRMLSYGIKSTPSLVIDEKVVSVSQPLSVEQIVKLIEEAANG
jgi:hypothetical protein